MSETSAIRPEERCAQNDRICAVGVGLVETSDVDQIGGSPRACYRSTGYAQRPVSAGSHSGITWAEARDASGGRRLGPRTRMSARCTRDTTYLNAAEADDSAERIALSQRGRRDLAMGPAVA
jgi:hypothetical protein